MRNKIKEQGIAITGTLLVCALLFGSLVLLNLTSRPNEYTEEMLGVPVMFGNVSDAFGDEEPLGLGTNQGAEPETASPNIAEDPRPMAEATSENASTPKDNTEETLATQNFEETIAIREAERINKEQKAKEAEEQRKKAEKELIARQEADKKAKLNQQMAGLFGNGDANNQGSRGETTGKGTQGVPTGNASYGATSGIGGWGTFELKDRNLGKGGLVKPEYKVNDYGTVVVDILVDPKGYVIEAAIGRGSSTTNATLINEALKAAKKTRFNEVNSVVNQRGFITYKFELN